MGYRTRQTIQNMKHLKKCLKSLLIRKIQITTTLRFHFALMGMAKINKKEKTAYIGKRCGLK